MGKILIYIYAWSIPARALAEVGGGETIESLLGKISQTIINPVINFLLVLATLVFLWGVIQYVIAGESSTKTEQAKRQIVWGLVGLTIMASAWSIVKIIQATLK